MRKIFFFILLLISFTTKAEDFLWYDIILPPFHHIPDGKYEKQGFSDEIKKILQRELNLKQKEFKIFPVNRLLYEMKKGHGRDEICLNPVLKKSPERSEFLLYGLPTVFVPGQGIIINKRDADYFKKNNSLQKLINNPKLKIGLEGTRSYGPCLDKILKRHQQDKNLVIQTNNNNIESLIKLLTGKRINLFLGTAIEYKYICLTKDIKDKLLYIPLKEADKYTVSYLAIGKNQPLAKKTLKEVNEILIKVRKTAEYRKMFERFLDKENIKQYRKDYNNIFLKMK